MWLEVEVGIDVRRRLLITCSEEANVLAWLKLEACEVLVRSVESVGGRARGEWGGEIDVVVVLQKRVFRVRGS